MRNRILEDATVLLVPLDLTVEAITELEAVVDGLKDIIRLIENNHDYVKK